MSNDLTISAAEYGLEPTKAEQIEKVFVPMQKVFHELDAEYKEIAATPEAEITPELCLKASALRKRYVKVRTSADEAHEKAKRSILIEGRAIDGLRNIIKFATSENEEKLEEIEKHFERKAQAEKEAKFEKRVTELSALGVDTSIYNLVEMHETVYQNLLSTSQKVFDEKKAAEAKAEEDRIAKEKEAAAENERIRTENERLKKEAQEREEKLAKERVKIAAENEKKRKEQEEKLRLEREAKEKAEAELKAKNDAEAAEALAKAKAEKEARLAPDKVKLEAFAASLIQTPMPSVGSVEANAVLLKAQELLQKISDYVLTQSQKI